jgi:hypothetical protein
MVSPPETAASSGGLEFILSRARLIGMVPSIAPGRANAAIGTQWQDE